MALSSTSVASANNSGLPTVLRRAGRVCVVQGGGHARFTSMVALKIIHHGSNPAGGVRNNPGPATAAGRLPASDAGSVHRPQRLPRISSTMRGVNATASLPIISKPLLKSPGAGGGRCMQMADYSAAEVEAVALDAIRLMVRPRPEHVARR